LGAVLPPLQIALQSVPPAPRGFRPVSPRSAFFGAPAVPVKVLIRQLG